MRSSTRFSPTASSTVATRCSVLSQGDRGWGERDVAVGSSTETFHRPVADSPPAMARSLLSSVSSAARGAMDSTEHDSTLCR